MTGFKKPDYCREKISFLMVQKRSYHQIKEELPKPGDSKVYSEIRKAKFSPYIDGRSLRTFLPVHSYTFLYTLSSTKYQSSDLSYSTYCRKKELSF